MKNIILSFFVFAGGALFVNETYASLDFWKAVDAPNVAVTVERSSDAQEGDKLLVIDGTSIDYNDEVEDILIQPKGLVVQTFFADHLIGKHLHISGFAKSYEPNFSLLKSQFDLKLQKQLESYKLVYADLYDYDEPSLFKDLIETSRENFYNWLSNSNSNADYGISVLLHLEGDAVEEKIIYKHLPTSRGKNSKFGWNRFNVEVSVPEACKALSVILWSDGINIVTFDHLAMVEQGAALESKGGERLLESDDLFQNLKKESQVSHKKMMNLSFEGE